MNKDKALKDYIDFKKTSVTSKEKLKDIERDVSRFLESSKKKLDDFQEKELINFLNSLDFKINTINSIKATLKNFLKWNFIDYPSRFRNLDRLCRTQKPQRTYEPEQMLSIKDVEKLVKAEKDLSWKVFLLVYFYGGFRPCEVVALSWDQIFFEPKGTIIKTYSKKNNKTFYKSVPDNVEDYLKEWKKVNDSKWLFPSPFKEGEHIGTKAVYYRIKVLSERALNKHVSPYILRHSIATIKYNEIEDADDVANQMGHSKNMKEVYLNLSENQMKTRARKIWKKVKLTPEEKDRVDKLEKELNAIKKELKPFMDNPKVIAILQKVMKKTTS